jgi:F0F1-type ATP synthase assembly protein I
LEAWKRPVRFDRPRIDVVTERRLFVGVQHHWKSAGAYSTLGLEIALSVIFGLFFGQWLDEKFDTGGWQTIFWFCIGLIAAGRSLYRALKRANREAELETKREEQELRKYLDEPKD